MASAFIGLGSNLGKGCCNLQLAWSRLAAHPQVQCRRLSSPYRTAPVDMTSRQWFTNAVGEVETDLTPEELLAVLLAVEAGMGRNRAETRDRIIDLDLLFYDGLINEDPGCRVPHPEMGRRLFVLIPLAEIAPDIRHPGTKLTPGEMIAALESSGQMIIKTVWQGGCHESI